MYLFFTRTLIITVGCIAIMQRRIHKKAADA